MEYSERYESIKAEGAKLYKAYDQKCRKLKASTAAISDLEDELDATRAELAQTRDAMKTVEMEYDKLYESYSTFVARYKEQETALGESLSREEALEARLAAAATNAAAAAAQGAHEGNADERVMALERQLDDANAMVATLNKTVEELRAYAADAATATATARTDSGDVGVDVDVDALLLSPKTQIQRHQQQRGGNVASGHVNSRIAGSSKSSTSKAASSATKSSSSTGSCASLPTSASTSSTSGFALASRLSVDSVVSADVSLAPLPDSPTSSSQCESRASISELKETIQSLSEQIASKTSHIEHLEVCCFVQRNSAARAHKCFDVV